MNSSSSSSPWSDAPPASTTSAAHTATVSLLLASVALATALANGLVIAAVAATPKLRHPANYLICSLAVADLLVALLVMPPGAAAAATGSWPLGPAACAVWTSADVTCCTASILSLCAIALDRYCAIARAVRYAPRRTPRRAAAMIAAVWVASILVSMPLALATPGAERDASARRRCAARHAHVLYAVVCTVGAFYAPMALLLVLYCGIYRAARSHFRRGLRGSRVLCGAVPNGGVVATGVSLAGVDAGVPLQEEAQGQDGHGHGRGQGRHQRLQGDDDENEDDKEEDRRGGDDDDERAPCEEMERVAVAAAGGQMEEGVEKRDEATVVVESQVPVAGILVPETQCQVAQTAAQSPWTESPLHRSRESRGSESGSDCRSQVALPRPQVSPPSSQDPRTGSQASHSDVPSPRRGSQASKRGFQIPQTQPRLSPATVNSAPPLVLTERPSRATQKPSQRAQPGSPQEPETHLLHASRAPPRNPQSKPRAPHNPQPAQPHVNSSREAAAAASASRPHRCRSLSASFWAPQAARGGGGGTASPRLRRISESRERRAAKTLGLILGAFTLCWLPFFVRELVVNVCEACAPPELLSELISWLGYANSLVNPLIYTTLNEDFRAAFKRMVGGGRGRWPGSPGSRRVIL
ncbi:unnamed protein product [Lampetra planeri]